MEDGIGSQYLTDTAPTILPNVPPDSTTRPAATVGIGCYTSSSWKRR